MAIRIRILTAALFIVAVGVTVADAQTSALDTELAVRVRLHWINDHRAFLAVGNAVSLTGDTLRVHELRSGRRSGVGGRQVVHGIHAVDLRDVQTIEVESGSKPHGGRGALIGSIIGGVFGLLVYSSTQSDEFLRAPADVVPASAVAGGLLGAGVGALIRTQQWRTVDRDELRQLLERRSMIAERLEALRAEEIKPELQPADD